MGDLASPGRAKGFRKGLVRLIGPQRGALGGTIGVQPLRQRGRGQPVVADGLALALAASSDAPILLPDLIAGWVAT